MITMYRQNYLREGLQAVLGGNSNMGLRLLGIVGFIQIALKGIVWIEFIAFDN